MKRRIEKRTYIPIIIALIFFMIVFLSYGISAFSSTFNITGDAVVRLSRDIRVTSISVGNTTNGGAGSNLGYSVNKISATTTLPSANSTVTYTFTITNIGNVEMGILDITETFKLNGSNTSNIKITNITGYDQNNASILCDNSDPTLCKLGSISTISVTIGYDTNGYNVNDSHEYEIMLEFDFRESYTISYSGLTTSAGLPTRILAGQTKTITFTSTTGIPTSSSDISIVGATPSYTNPNLTISNPTGNVTITATLSGGGSGTQADPYIDNSSTYDPTSVQDGYTVFTDAPGAPKVSATVTTQNGVTTTTINSFEFTDTGTNGVDFGTNGNPKVDTGVLVLDSQNSVFSIHIVFKTTLKLTVNGNNINSGKFVLAALSEVSSNTYSGFSIWVLNSSTPTLNIGIYDRKTYSNGVLSATRNQVLTTSADANSGVENVYEVWLSYDQGTFGGQAFKYQCYNNANNNGTNNCSSTSQQSLQKKNIPTGLTNTTISIGGNGLNNSNDIGEMTILELQICKGQFGSNYSCPV